MSDQLNVTLTGTAIHIKPAEQITDRFRKQEIVVLVEDSKYPQEIPVEFINDRIDMLENLGINEGDAVTVACNLRGRAGRNGDRWFMSLGCWKIDIDQRAAKAEATQDEPPPMPPQTMDDEDLPF